MENNKGQEYSRGLSFLKGAIIGGIVGAIAALAFAPKSGKELRADIKRRTNELANDADEALQVLHEKTDKILAEGRKKADVLLQEIEQKLTSIKVNPNELYESGKEMAQKVKDTVVKTADTLADKASKFREKKVKTEEEA